MSEETVKETAVVKMYLHGCKESNWDLAEEMELSEEAAGNFAYALLEVEFDVEVNIKTGSTKIVAVDGCKLCEC